MGGMPARSHSDSRQLKSLLRFTSTTEAAFAQQHPQTSSYMRDNGIVLAELRNRQQRESVHAATPQSEAVLAVTQAVNQRQNTHDHLLTSDITREEFTTILQKLCTVLAGPPGKIEETSLLYLEQQLSDLLGCNLVGALEGHELPFHTGVVRAEAHCKRFPADTLEEHDRFFEAGLRTTRSYFGWFMTNNSLTPQAQLKERYSVSLPLHLLQDWNDDAVQRWYAFRKVVLLNPFDQRAVVSCIGDVYFGGTLKYQLGGSPELIREGLIWSPTAQGKVCVLFIDDPDDQVPLGPLSMRTPSL